MYHDCSKGRELGQTIIVIDPERFCGAEQFKKNMSQTCDELNAMRPAPGIRQSILPRTESSYEKRQRLMLKVESKS